MARYQEKIKEAYLLIIGERKRAPEKLVLKIIINEIKNSLYNT